jgi:chemotaxis protein histidine kinase CheA
VSGATLSGDGSVVLVLDIEAMLDEPGSVMLGYRFNQLASRTPDAAASIAPAWAA